MSSEKDNLYITMAARQLNSRIRIVARTADVVNTGKKLFKGSALIEHADTIVVLGSKDQINELTKQAEAC